MKYTKTIFSAFAALLFSVAVVQGQQTNAPVATTPAVVPQTVINDGIWRFSLSGQGATATDNTKGNSSVIGAGFELGREVTLGLPGELGIRQDIGFSDASSLEVVKVKVKGKETTKTEEVGGSDIDLGTKLYYDWRLFRLGNVEFDAGGNAGALYGNRTLDWQTSPEVVARVFLTKDVNAFARVEYPFDINAGSFDSSVVYSLGLQVRF